MACDVLPVAMFILRVHLTLDFDFIPCEQFFSDGCSSKETRCFAFWKSPSFQKNRAAQRIRTTWHCIILCCNDYLQNFFYANSVLWFRPLCELQYTSIWNTWICIFVLYLLYHCQLCIEGIVFVGYKGVTVWPSGPEQAPRPEVTHRVAAKGLIQYLVRKGLGVILFFCYSSFYNLWVPWFSLLEIYQNSFHAVGWVQCVVRFTIFYGFHSNLLWVAVNSDLVVWQTF